MINEIKNIGKIIDIVKDKFGNIVYEAWKKLLASGLLPLTLNKCKGVDLVDYKIYGESVQDGEPTPEAPIEVESVGDRTKNLFNNDTSLLGQITYYGSSGNTGIRIGYKILLPPGTYTIHAEGTPNVQYIYGIINSANNEYISGVNIVVHNSLYTITFTINEGDILYLYNGSSNLNVAPAIELFNSFNIQIEEGTIATDYEPYGKYKIPVKVSSKNLLLGDVLKASSYGGFYGSTHPTDYKLPFIEANKTYTISFDYSNNSESYYYLMKRKDDENIIVRYLTSIDSHNGKHTYTFTAEEDAEYYFYGNNPIYLSNFIANTTYLQIEEGTEATEFDGYASINNIYINEPLRKIGDYADYIDFEAGQVVRKIYTEFIAKVNSVSRLAGTYSLFLSPISKKPYLINIGTTGNDVIGFVLSNKFIKHNETYGELVYHGGYIQTYLTSGGSYRVAYSFNDSSINTVELAQEKIGDGFEVNYVLETPDPQPIELPNIPTFKGTTILSIDSNVSSSYMEAVYIGKGKLQLLAEEDNLILNDILATDTETDLNITNTEINEILDEIIGG